MQDNRPTPEQMLARLQTEGDDGLAAKRRGRLKIFFGYAAGVGKTYAMLQEAQRLKSDGHEVVVGYVEPHGRRETEASLEGLEQLPLRQVNHRGALLQEFNLDAALSREPEIILVDELAHTNAPQSVHSKRWQDVEELLQAGIDVYSTCNVQHVESLNDIVAKISGIVVRETVPDDVFRRADELTIIDIAPEELLARLKEGKVYVPAQVERALERFFRKENLFALRELALRRVTERVHADVETARHGHGGNDVWPTGETLLVCVGPSPSSASVIRSAKRLANAIQAELVAVHIENASTQQLPSEARNRLVNHLRLAERLGAETVTLAGDDLVAETLSLAKRKNVTKIVIGKSDASRRWFRQRASITDRLIQDSGEVDIYVIRGKATGDSMVGNDPETRAPSASTQSKLFGWLGTVGILCLATSLAWLLDRLGASEANIVMAFLLGVVCVALRYRRWHAFVASMGAVLLFDVFFTTPYYTVVVDDAQYLVTFAVMAVVGLIVTALTRRLRETLWQTQRNTRQTEALYQLGRKLSGISGQQFLASEAERAISELFQLQAIVLLPDDGTLRPVFHREASFAADPSELAVARWAFEHEMIAGRGTETLAASQATYLPLLSPAGAMGVLAIQAEDVEPLFIPESRRVLEAYASQLALALERDRLAIESQEATSAVEKEQLRSTLLTSLSHDLRTPLAVICGASSSILHANSKLDTATQHELLETIHDESARLSRLVENLLRLTQLSSGHVEVSKEWFPVEELLGSALGRLEHSLSSRNIRIDLKPSMLMAHCDSVLIEQVFINLLENACRYSPAESEIEIRGRQKGKRTILEIADHGPGISKGDEQRVFEKFQRGEQSSTDSRGVGLGLAICKAVMDAHGGKISVFNAESGGAVFRLELVADEMPPTAGEHTEDSLISGAEQ
ncbi:sensor histidine kinase [Stieleria varia]|uniref:histidine kinase n=1 Tax=Stieleria varia TaxID=2528005 RepID=A0A5C6B469_9BACT|nr:sensor histidine kinase KdpD [Stieleria varia]TWU06281.1 Sensor protein KdpD [Stieleria varia]